MEFTSLGKAPFSFHFCRYNPHIPPIPTFRIIRSLYSIIISPFLHGKGIGDYSGSWLQVKKLSTQFHIDFRKQKHENNRGLRKNHIPKGPPQYLKSSLS